MFDFLRRGLDRPLERWCLATSVLLCTGYLCAFAALQFASVRIDDQFMAAREQVLSVRLRNFPLPLDKPLSLAKGGSGAPFFGFLGGWSDAESWGIWTDGAHAEFVATLPESLATPAALEIRAMVVLPRAGTQDVVFFADHRQVGRWKLDRPQTVICIPLPAGSASGGLLRLGISIGSPHRPAVGTDDRDLGIGLEQAELLSSPAQCATDDSPRLN